MGTEDTINLPVFPQLKFNEHLMYPNLKFAAKEVSDVVSRVNQ
jgi:hypothetical protein